jgi:hypothetical protein
MAIETIIAIIQALIGFAGQVPELITAGETAMTLLRTGVAPTAEQQAQIDAALDAANAALQAS